ncbi:hypothetical protein [Enterobacter sp.]|uniref:hypothetical protein n=1 Tax=Enterobacter sp. TaxID=42895 RepID=UPI00296FDF5F|nr:hypothetical protein [Enterobacter sp.]
MITENLLNSLNELIAALNNSNKKSSADFFMLRYEAIKKSNNALESIKELSTCRAMAQYANFALAEESKLDTVVDCAIDILKKHNL